jgi:hypothetical protein
MAKYDPPSTNRPAEDQSQKGVHIVVDTVGTLSINNSNTTMDPRKPEKQHTIWETLTSTTNLVSAIIGLIVAIGGVEAVKARKKLGPGWRRRLKQECAECRKPFQENENRVKCPKCHAIVHESCWCDSMDCPVCIMHSV